MKGSNAWWFAVLFVLLAAAVFAAGALPGLLGLPPWIDPVQTLVDELYVDIFVALLTIAVIVGVIDRRNRRRLEGQRRQELVDQLSSRVPGFPAEAVRLLKHHGWYRDKDALRGMQAGGDFYLADLRGLTAPKRASGLQVEEGRLDLEGARLAGADLGGAHLEGVSLNKAHLARANLSNAYLAGASLIAAHLAETDLSDAHLTGADLLMANLEGANLHGAELTGARGLTTGQLEAASTLGFCMLPDGTHLPFVLLDDDPELYWAFADWVKRGREEGWIYSTLSHEGDTEGGYIDVDKIPPREGEGADS